MNSTAASDVKRALQTLLKVADLQKTSEEDLQNSLSSLLQIADMAPYQQLIQEEVEAFILNQAREQAPVAPAAPGKRQRGDCVEDLSPDSNKQVKSVVKASAPAPASAAADESAGTDIALTEDGMTRCTLREFKGSTYVDLRKFYQKDEKRMPTKKGLMLSVQDWNLLTAGFLALSQALAESNSAASVALTGDRQATISDLSKKALSVDVREWYTKDGKRCPGAKGVHLPAAAFEELQRHAPIITAALLSENRASSSHENAQPPVPVRAASAHVQLPGSGSSVAAPAAAGGEKGSAVDGNGVHLWPLGGSKFASVSDFKGAKLIGLREYYQKDGAWLPGKKGISLSMEQFASLRASHASITTGLMACDESLSVGIGKMRRAAVSSFKGKLYVNIREFYQKDGQELPGKKGLSLDPSQWQALTSAMESLHQATS